MLAEYGDISQTPVSHMTVMTTGKSGVVQTPYGMIEFTHTKRGRAEVVRRSLYVIGRPMRIATRSAAIEDLHRVGRNMNMLNADAQDNSLGVGANAGRTA